MPSVTTFTGAGASRFLDRANPRLPPPLPSCFFTSGGKRSKSSLPLPLLLQRKRVPHRRANEPLEAAVWVKARQTIVWQASSMTRRTVDNDRGRGRILGRTGCVIDCRNSKNGK
jgi:hypothetical protein